MDSLLVFPRTQAEKQFLSELMNRMGIRTAAVPAEYLEDKEDIRLFDQAQLEAGEPVSMDAYLKSRTSRKKHRLCPGGKVPWPETSKSW